MVSPVYTPTPQIEDRLKLLDALREEILHVPINNLIAARLTRKSILYSIYYSLFLSKIEAYMGDVESLIFSENKVSIDKQKALIYRNYAKLIIYIHDYYSKSNAEISTDFICNFHTICFSDIVHKSEIGIYRTQDTINDVKNKYQAMPTEYIEDAMNKLCAFIHTKDTIPTILKASFFYIEFMKICPFPNGNGRVARALTLLYLYRNGYALGGFFSPERYLAVNRGRKYRLALTKARGSSFDATADIEPFFQLFLSSAISDATNILRSIKNPRTQSEEIKDLNERQKRLLSYLKENKRITLGEYLTYIEKNPSFATRDFDKLRDNGILEKKGFGKSTYYLLRKNLNLL